MIKYEFLKYICHETLYDQTFEKSKLEFESITDKTSNARCDNSLDPRRN